MGAQFTTNAVSWSGFDSEAVLITRRSASETLPPIWSTATIYSGPGDLQIAGAASLQFNPSGAVDSVVGELMIDPDSNGVLPSVNPGDIVTIAGITYEVANATPWNVAPIHLEITLRRGPTSYGLTKG